ncbi:MAG: hypothetical protein M0C28_18550 [Candidatus Moduliflexus flocculans]|nr:hypothetical protein [Candidatus Moduliflexus flocculans]
MNKTVVVTGGVFGNRVRDRDPASRSRLGCRRRLPVAPEADVRIRLRDGRPDAGRRRRSAPSANGSCPPTRRSTPSSTAPAWASPGRSRKPPWPRSKRQFDVNLFRHLHDHEGLAARPARRARAASSTSLRSPPNSRSPSSAFYSMSKAAMNAFTDTASARIEAAFRASVRRPAGRYQDRLHPKPRESGGADRRL